MQDILLSIIIPVYNVEDYLHECLDSVFTQDLTNCEVICVNDGSTDNSLNILMEYKGRYPELIIHNKTNGGQATARNLGLKNAKGTYIYFFDSDDFLLANATRQMKCLLINKLTDVLILNALVNEKEQYIAGVDKLEHKIYTGLQFVEKSMELTGTLPTPVWLYVYKRDFLLENHLFQKENLYHEDEYFTMQVLFYAKSVIIYDFIALNYRVLRVGATTTTTNKKWITDRIWIAQALYDFYCKNGVAEPAFFKKNFEFLVVSVKLLYETPYDALFRKEMNKDILSLMRKMSVSDRGKKIVKLQSLNPVFMLKYTDNTIAPIFRKLINRFL